MKASILLKRLRAFAIDYFLILAYMACLFGVVLAVSGIFQLQLIGIDPASGQLIAFITLTLPVILYFTLSENGKNAGTIGKRRSGLQVLGLNSGRAGLGRLLLRNCIKFLPWELAHFFLFRLFYFNAANKTVPGWVLAGLLLAQGLAIIYVLCILIRKDKRSIYELLSQTRVTQQQL